MSPIDFSITNFKQLKQKTCAEVLVEYLEIEGVEYVFGVSGGTVISLLEAIDKSEKISFIMCKHEGSASFMADMYARMTGKTGVCLSTAGPGATNMLTGVACAQMDNIPLLAITGQPATHTAGKGAVQESSEFGVDTVAIYGQFTGFSSCISDAAAFQQILVRALRVAQAESKQAVHISIPSNISGHIFESINVHTNFKKYRISHAAIDFAQIHKAAEILINAKKPLILLGSGFQYGEHIDGLIRIAEIVGSPVVTTPQGKGLFPEDHPLSLGVFGFAGNLSAKKYMLEENIDVLVVIASSLGEWTTESWNPRLFPSKYFIQIDVDSQNIGQNFPVSLGIVGDVSAVIKELYKILLSMSCRIDSAGKNILKQETRQRRENVLLLKKETGSVQKPQKLLSDEIPLKPQRVMHDLNICIEKDAVIIVDAGNAYAWTLHYLKLRHPQRFIIPLGFASMGHATAGVIGAALGAPLRQVIAVVGDGSMLMNGNEVHTAVEYKIPAIWIILNDSRWGMVYHGNKAVSGKGLSSEYHSTDFVQFARTMGAKGYRVTKPGELCKILPIIQKEKQPTVIDVIIDGDEEPPFLERVLAVKQYMKKDN
ncbi:MAG: thiamine pyrophosphate-binding protein [Spirochaetales bacterium]|nr:thiamine pyrophosphate-binding protein [Spirochaetales bacterium]